VDHSDGRVRHPSVLHVGDRRTPSTGLLAMEGYVTTNIIISWQLLITVIMFEDTTVQNRAATHAMIPSILMGTFVVPKTS
jgi:hypothetical protein